ncbi:S-adenosylmethionine uptake transporter [Mitsuaria sp. BK045]|uniref:DMT family transporter n=1 Tax=unclassified Roseateles TaxID=2626991 RepID=UPI00161ADCF5|nr:MULTISPECIES: DMT family transporter [unclassified Roseateles]MBB3294543.1 S-adenosylmethionine uptake transporter [Mitsuaria sp. BK041]MBB3363759.1 S-adenosylmethionine uptake transporter [Mitsuaria sp. BK045]
MSAPLLMVLATLLFATMGVCVKLASAYYGAGEIVMYRGLVGTLFLFAMTRVKGLSLKTTVPAMHFWRSLSGVIALSLWFFAISKLPLATAMTLNYMSSVWMALFLIGGAVLMGAAKVDPRLIITVLLGFLGVGLVLQPAMEDQQVWHGLAGLASGMLSAMAYLQVTSLGRAGEPEYRIVFYFSMGGVVAGALTTIASHGGWHDHTWTGAALLLAVGVLATAAQLLMTRAYGTGKPLVNASLQYLGIVFSALYGVLLFGDRLGLASWIGILLIVGAGLGATLLRARNTPKDAQHSVQES